MNSSFTGGHVWVELVFAFEVAFDLSDSDGG